MTFCPFRPIEKGTETGLEIFVRLTPKAAHNRIQGLYFDIKEQCYLKVTVTSPPIDGEANQALIRFLAKKLSISPSSLSILRGHTDRYKTLYAQNLSLEDAKKILLP